MTSRIRQLIPNSWATKAPIFARFAEALAAPLDLWYGKVQGVIGELLDPRSVSPERLDWLMYLVGIDFSATVDDAVKRALIEIAYDVWENKGTIYAIELWLRAIVGNDASVTNTADGTAFIAGVNLADDVCGVGYAGFSFALNVPFSAGYSEAEIRDLMIPAIPSFMTYTINWI